jgi:sugar phosphate isomerase/epimerase
MNKTMLKAAFLIVCALCPSLFAGAADLERLQTNCPACDDLGWQLAITPYSFRLYPISEAIDKTAQVGIKYIGLSGNINVDAKTTVKVLDLTDEQLQSIRKKCDADGVKIINLGIVPLPADEAECRKAFEFAKKLGVDTIVAEPPPEALDIVEKLCKEYNIKVAIHDHPRPSHYWNPDTVLAAIKGRTPLMGACADVGHWMRSGLDPVECLKKLEGHVICLHFKDVVPDKPDEGPPPPNGARKMHDVPWGTGDSNVKGMMEELKRQHFHGAFYVEYEYHWATSQPEIAQSVKYFNATATELAK